MALDQAWHSGERLQGKLLDFHQNRAMFPESSVREAQRHLRETLETIRDHLQRNGTALQFEYTGSTYEGIKVPSTGMEFDVMVVLASGGDVTAREARTSPLYATLTTTGRYEVLTKMSDAASDDPAPNQPRVLMPRKTAGYFMLQLQRVVHNYPNLANIIKIRLHGPAVQMDVHREVTGSAAGSLFYSVDLVPAFQVPRFGRYYVAKAFKDADSKSEQDTWRVSYSLDEKIKMQSFDRGNKCHKQCIRIIKVIRDKEEGLRALNTYMIKTAVFTLDRNKVLLDWHQRYLGRRFMDVLKFLVAALEEGKLPHFYVARFNLLQGMEPRQLDKMKCHLKDLIRSELHLQTVLNTCSRN